MSLYPIFIAEYTLFTVSSGLIRKVPMPNTGACTPFESVTYSIYLFLLRSFFFMVSVYSDFRMMYNANNEFCYN